MNDQERPSTPPVELAYAACGCRGIPGKQGGYDTITVVCTCEEHRAKANIIGKRMWMAAGPPEGTEQ